MFIFLALTGLPADPSHAQLTDHQLIQRYQETDDTRYVLELLLRYEAYLTAVYVRMAPGPDVSVEEAVQELFLLLCKKLVGVAPAQIKKVSGFLGFMVRNHLIDLIRKQKRHEDWESQQRLLPAWSLTQIGEQMDRKALMDRIQDLLSEKEWQCVQLFYLEHHSYKEVAKALDMSFNQVRGTLNRAVERMRAAFASAPKQQEVNNPQ